MRRERAGLLLLVAAFGLSPTVAAVAQTGVSATAPAPPASPQRRAILDALRPTIQRQLGGPVEFVVSRLDVLDGWALVYADPQRPGGGAIDGRRYFPDFENMDGLTVTALLRFRNGGWTRFDHAIGATDVWYCDGHNPAPNALTQCSY